MYPFAGMNKAYRLTPSRESQDFLESCLSAVEAPATVVFHQGEGSFTGPDGLLAKILNAAKVAEKERIVVDAAALPDLRLRMIRKAFPTVRFVILFGVRPAAAGLNAAVTAYQPVQVGPYTVLGSLPLEKLEEDASSKRSLWEAMKEMYAL